MTKVISSRAQLDKYIAEAICTHLGVKSINDIPDNQVQSLYFDPGIDNHRFTFSKSDGDDWTLRYRWFPPKSSKAHVMMEEIVYESLQGARTTLYLSHYLFGNEIEHNWLGKLLNDEIHLVFR